MDDSPSERIDARIEELDDWRGDHPGARPPADREGRPGRGRRKEVARRASTPRA
jgi:hypothetical protein